MDLDQLETKLAEMLPDHQIPRNWTPEQYDAYVAQRTMLGHRIRGVRAAHETLTEVEPELNLLTKQQADLTAIRDECCAELLTFPPRTSNRQQMDALQGVKISILTIDGRFDVHNDAIPVVLPLFEKLKARGYTAPGHAPWNVMASLFGSLPTIERRVRTLEARRAEAQGLIDAVRAAT